MPCKSQAKRRHRWQRCPLRFFLAMRRRTFRDCDSSKGSCVGARWHCRENVSKTCVEEKDLLGPEHADRIRQRERSQSLKGLVNYCCGAHLPDILGCGRLLKAMLVAYATCHCPPPGRAVDLNAKTSSDQEVHKKVGGFLSRKYRGSKLATFVHGRIHQAPHLHFQAGHMATRHTQSMRFQRPTLRTVCTQPILDYTHNCS